MHTETALLATVRRKGGQGRVRNNGKRLSVLLVMHWKFRAAETMRQDNLPNEANTTVQDAMD